VCEVVPDIAGGEIAWVPFAVEDDELPDAEQVSLFGAKAHLPATKGASDESEEGLDRLHVV